MDPVLETLLAKEAIREVLAAHTRAIDRADGELLKSCYHADAVEEHGGNYAGNAHAYADEAIPRVMRMGVMQHLLGTSYIDLQGHMAWVETNLWTFARFEKAGQPLDTFTGGRLIDRFERRNGEWKIAHRRTVFDWNRDTPSNEGWCMGLFTPGKPGMLVGRKGKQDASYERF